MEYGLNSSNMTVDSFDYFTKTYLDSLNLQIGYFETISSKINDINEREANTKDLEVLQAAYAEINSKDFLKEETLAMNFKAYSESIALLGDLQDKKELKAAEKAAKEEIRLLDKQYKEASKALMKISKDVKDVIRESKHERLVQQIIEKNENAKLESIKNHRKRIEKYIGDYEYLAKMFAKDSPMQEATQVLVSAWKRQLASL